MKEIYSVLVLMHPVNHKGCFEILFSYDGNRYSSVDGNSPNYFRNLGMTTACRFEVNQFQFYKLMAKSLDIKIKTLDLYVRYKDYSRRLGVFKKLSERCINAQCKYSEDLDIPESVIALANASIISPV